MLYANASACVSAVHSLPCYRIASTFIANVRFAVNLGVGICQRFGSFQSVLFLDF